LSIFPHLDHFFSPRSSSGLSVSEVRISNEPPSSPAPTLTSTSQPIKADKITQAVTTTYFIGSLLAWGEYRN
jgi:hypothetical protein